MTEIDPVLKESLRQCVHSFANKMEELTQEEIDQLDEGLLFGNQMIMNGVDGNSYILRAKLKIHLEEFRF